MTLRSCGGVARIASIVGTSAALAAALVTACARPERMEAPAGALRFEGAPVPVLDRLPARAAADTDSVATVAGNASVLCGTDAVVYVAWTASAEDSTDLLLARSPDLGEHFTEPARINEAAGRVAAPHAAEMRPQIALDRLGRVYAVWTGRRPDGEPPASFDVYCARSEDGGASFRPAVRVDDGPDSTSQAMAAMSLDDAGGIWVAWLDARGAAPEDPHHAKVRISTSKDGGESFLPSVDATAALAHGVCECCRPAVAAGGLDVIVLFRDKVDGVRDIAMARSIDGGATFDSTRAVADDGWRTETCPADGPALVMLPGAGRRWAAAWSTGAGGKRVVKLLAASLDDSAFAAPVLVPPAAEGVDQKHPALFARDSLLVVSWEEESGGGARIALALSRDGGLTFAPSQAIEAPQVFASRRPAAALAGKRHFIFVWSVGEAPGGVRLARGLLQGDEPKRVPPS